MINSIVTKQKQGKLFVGIIMQGRFVRVTAEEVYIDGLCEDRDATVKQYLRNINVLAYLFDKIFLLTIRGKR